MDWADFTERLARELAGLHPQMVLVVHRSVQGSHYVQAFRTGDNLHAEAVSSEVLIADLRFDRRSEDRLAELGWERPESYGNWTFDLPFASPPAAFRRLASIMVIALRDVQGAQEPSELRYEAFRDTVFLDLPELGLEQSDPTRPAERHVPPPLAPAPRPAPPPEPPPYSPQTQPLSLPFPPEPPSAPEPEGPPTVWDTPFTPADLGDPGAPTPPDAPVGPHPGSSDPALPTAPAHPSEADDPLSSGRSHNTFGSPAHAPEADDPLTSGRFSSTLGSPESSGPGLPNAPEQPGDPLDPNTPLEWFGPPESSDPGVPAYPSDSDTPNAPADPLGPTGSGDPGVPGRPSVTDDPLDLSRPYSPPGPAESSDPSVPVAPAHGPDADDPLASGRSYGSFGSAAPGTPASPAHAPEADDPLTSGRFSSAFASPESSGPGLPNAPEQPGDPLDPNTPLDRLGPTRSSGLGIPNASADPLGSSGSSGPGFSSVPASPSDADDPLASGRSHSTLGSPESSGPGLPNAPERPDGPLGPNTPADRLGPAESGSAGVPGVPEYRSGVDDPLASGRYGSFGAAGAGEADVPAASAQTSGQDDPLGLGGAYDPLTTVPIPPGSAVRGGAEEDRRHRSSDEVPQMPRVPTPEPSAVPESAVSPPSPPQSSAPEAQGPSGRARMNKTAIRLAEAKANGDREGYLAVLLSAELYVAGTVVYEDGVYVRAFTAPPPEPHRATDLRTLAGQWPQPHWQLAIDDGHPDAGYLDPFTIAKVGRPPVRTVMQKVVPHPLVVHYLEGGYDRVAGYVHRVSDVLQLTTPKQMYSALGLGHPGSSFSPDDESVHVLRWHARFAEMLRPPYGGTDEASMAATPGGWVVEHPPFEGNGFAPGTGTAIPEFKIDSQRLPHGAELYRFDRSGRRTLVALFDADGTRWVAL